ncbi:hypothetical protein Slip_1197 [Syntrophothermus lipocalidus DSM 12680]|uniref:Uncharacterized protein n=1 Tax=Syntrophothermus lipocalidus (strain DSM 12680 / TGB-C1) TaxID=643648 RepID=D7CMN5_SYNLT|nr:hypothetical protein Slip_1197 [Syntrophothermus lipocalidus DSM 12680]
MSLGAYFKLLFSCGAGLNPAFFYLLSRVECVRAFQRACLSPPWRNISHAFAFSMLQIPEPETLEDRTQRT